VSRPVTLITGASAGIGAELAKLFAENGHALALVARREAALSALADEIASRGVARPAVIAFDLAQSDVGTKLRAALDALGLEVDHVVNNAGFGLVGASADISRAEQLAMIDLNVRALTDLSLAFVDQLARHRGGILNLGSVAGFMPGPGSAVYYATKAFVLSFSEALQAELASRGVRVTTLCPGPVPTEFQVRAGMARSELPGPLTRSAREAAVAGYRGLMAGKRVVFAGWPNALVARLASILPSGLVLWAMLRVQARRYGIDLPR
jgi:short-subunit dehydrogenase